MSRGLHAGWVSRGSSARLHACTVACWHFPTETRGFFKYSSRQQKESGGAWGRATAEGGTGGAESTCRLRLAQQQRAAPHERIRAAGTETRVFAHF